MLVTGVIQASQQPQTERWLDPNLQLPAPRAARDSGGHARSDTQHEGKAPSKEGELETPRAQPGVPTNRRRRNSPSLVRDLIYSISESKSLGHEACRWLEREYVPFCNIFRVSNLGLKREACRPRLASTPPYYVESEKTK
jgi:hypothetical protein